MRILQIAPRFPYPPDDGGRIGIWNITRQFKALGHTIWLVTFRERDTHPHHIERLRSVVDRLTVLPVLQFRWWQYGIAALHPVPIHIQKRRGRMVMRAADQIAEFADQFDVIHVDGTGMLPMGLRIARRTDTPIGVRMHNVEWVIWDRYAQQFPRWHPARWYLRRQAVLLKRWEARLLTAVDVIFAITQPDRDRITTEMGVNKRTLVVPAGVDLDWWSPPVSEPQSANAILAANFEWRPNVEGLRWFADTVLPQLPTSLTFHIVGKQSKERLLFLQAFRNVRIHGYVDDVRSWYRSATVAFVPLLTGGGIRIKILEAMAMGLPVVTTPVGAEGIEAGADEGVFRESDPKNFAERLQWLMQHPQEAWRLGQKARKVVQKRYSWQSLVAQIVTAYSHRLHASPAVMSHPFSA